jgi:micrococcal nuclease
MPRSPARRRFFLFISVLLSAFLYFFPKESVQSVSDLLLTDRNDKSPSIVDAGDWKAILGNGRVNKDLPSESAPVESLIVKRVVDGDTFILSNGEKIRLTGIDTPESHDNPKAIRDSQRSGKDILTITQQGKEAAQFVRKLAEGKKIRIEYDVQKRDRYGRLLVYAYDIDTLQENPQIHLPKGIIVSANHEIFLNGSIIGSGYAIPMTIPPNIKHAELFKKLYSEARSQRRGLWAE